MGLKVIGPNINSQDLNDNYSYLDQKSGELYTARFINNSIPSVKLKTTTDDDKIKLANLAVEVKDAMAGTTTIDSTPGTESVTTSTIAPEAVTLSKILQDDLMKLQTGFFNSKNNDAINFDFVNKKIVIPDGYLVFGVVYQAVTATEISMVSPVGDDGVRFFAFDLIARQFLTWRFDNTANVLPGKNIIILGTFWGEVGTPVVSANFDIKVNGEFQQSKNNSERGIFVGEDFIDFDFNDRKVYIPKGFIQYNNGYYDPAGGSNTVTSKSGYDWEIDFPASSYGINSLFYDYKTKNFSCLNYQNYSQLTNTSILLFSFYDEDRRVFGDKVKVDGAVQEGQSFNDVDDRLVLPPKMFFVEGDFLPVYKSSIVPTVDTVSFQTALQITDAAGRPRNRFFTEDIELEAGDITDNIRFWIKQDQDPKHFYYQDVQSTVATLTANSGKTPTMLMIGDSLTNRYMPAYTKDKLVDYGVTPTMVGTMANLGGESGEGREGWEFENFIGKDNTHMGGTVITRSTSGATTTNYENPFLKLADSTDKSNHPDWCYRNTGSDSELSYTSDPDKTGNFYIFDFAWYLSNHGITAPDIVTIALSTNDFSEEPYSTALSNCRHGLEIMVKQIKTALPNCKIGVVPSPVYASDDFGNGRWQTACKWIEIAMDDLASFGLADTEIIPVWAHMSRDLDFPLTDVGTVTTNNDTMKAALSENIHFGTPGRREYAAAVGAYVMNVI